MFIFLYYRTDRRAAITKGSFPRLLKFDSELKSTRTQYYKCWCPINMIVAYDINRYSLLSDNKYYRYRTFPYTPGTNAMCIFYKFKYMCNQLVISKGILVAY